MSITVFRVVVRPQAKESPPLGPKDPAKLTKYRSVVLSRYVDDCVIAHDGVEGAGPHRENGHLGDNGLKSGGVTPGQHQLGQGQIDAHHLMAELGQAVGYRHAGPAPHVQYSRSRR